MSNPKNEIYGCVKLLHYFKKCDTKPYDDPRTMKTCILPIQVWVKVLC